MGLEKFYSLFSPHSLKNIYAETRWSSEKVHPDVESMTFSKILFVNLFEILRKTMFKTNRKYYSGVVIEETITYGSRYSKMDQVELVADSL